MRIDDVLNRNEQGFSFEFFPPKSEAAMEPFMTMVKELERFNPLYCSVTYGAGGTTHERTRDTLFALQRETGLTLMSHLTCIGATKELLNGLLRDYIENGIENILALRGDPPQGGENFDPLKGEFRYAKDLVEFVKTYNAFSISVAVYPEVHQESPSIEADMEYTKRKIDAGADFGITQMFFDNQYYYAFRDRAIKKGISIPILPGIMPITDMNKIMKFAAFCKANIPLRIRERMEGVLDNPEEMEKIGIEIAISQCEDLLDNGVDYLHFYTMNKARVVGSILDALQGRFKKNTASAAGTSSLP